MTNQKRKKSCRAEKGKNNSIIYSATLIGIYVPGTLPSTGERKIKIHIPATKKCIIMHGIIVYF